MKLGLFSISYAGLWGQSTIDLCQFIHRAKALGYDSVMLAGKRPQLSALDANADQIDSLKGALNDAGVTCSAVAAYNDFGAKSGAEVPLLEMQILYVESLCRIASMLGARLIRLFTSYLGAEPDSQRTWQQAVVAFREIADRAGDHSITIAIQNHHDLAVDTVNLLEMLHDIGRPNCKLGFDAWSPALRGEDLFQSAKMAAPHTAMTTNADYLRLPRFRYRPDLINYERISPDLVRAVPFGAGCIDYGTFFRGLKEGGFDGLASYEMCSPIRGGGSLENLDGYARTYISWMKTHGY
jgi:sugar phosphate isomerase/epimerase